MKKSLILAVFLAPAGLFAQTNLVPNGGFEEYTDCPTDQDQVSLAFPWRKPSLPGTEFFHTCSSSAFVSIPSGGFCNYQYPFEGNGMAGIYVFLFGGPTRDYISTVLTEPLIAGEIYTVSFYLNLKNDTKYATPDVAVYFSNDEINEDIYWELPYEPQVYNYGDIYCSDTINWTIFKNTYLAQGGEEYITIGNFKTNANTDTIEVNESVFTSRDIYYLLDNVSIIKGNYLDVKPNEPECFKVYLNGDYLELVSTNASNAVFSLVDSYGNLIFKDSYQDTSNYSKNMGYLKNGMYFLKIEIETNVSTYKIMKL